MLVPFHPNNDMSVTGRGKAASGWQVRTMHNAEGTAMVNELFKVYSKDKKLSCRRCSMSCFSLGHSRSPKVVCISYRF